MLRNAFTLVLLLVAGSALGETRSLLDARRGHKTRLTRTARDEKLLGEPNAKLFSFVRFNSPLGKMAAYLSRPAKLDVKHPAIIWITGGFPVGGIGEGAWKRTPSDNDQSAKAYRLAGMVMMYPTVRGSFGNPGRQESFYGEVDDILAALKYLKQVPYVDPERIYLGGHSTGGTLALLVAQASPEFRAVFAFGPVANPASYGAKLLTYDPKDKQEARLRSPLQFLSALSSPTFVIEGTEGGNVDSLHALRKASSNPKLVCLPVEGATHFDVLFPVNRLIANRIAALDAKTEATLSRAEVQRAFDDHSTAMREASDLDTIANARRAGIDLNTPRVVRHYLLARERAGLDAAGKAAVAAGLTAVVKAHKDSRGKPYYALTISKRLALAKLRDVFDLSRYASRLARQFDVRYDGWESN